jgi:hypothetical protein
MSDPITLTRLTSEQAAIIGAFTGFLCGPFDELHAYIERVMERPVWTHEMAAEGWGDVLQEAARADFMSLVAEGASREP